MHRSIRICCALLLFLVAIPLNAVASPISYTFTGAVGIAGIPGFSVGDPIVGSFVYDPDGPLLNFGPTFVNFYPTVATISATVAGSPFVSSGPMFERVVDNNFVDFSDMFPSGIYDSFELFNAGSQLGLRFFDADATFFDTFPGLPVLPVLPAVLPLSAFEYAVLFINPAGEGGSANFAGLVSVAPAVPEPGTFLLIGTGLAALWKRRRPPAF